MADAGDARATTGTAATAVTRSVRVSLDAVVRDRVIAASSRRTAAIRCG
jgi:hypothetical protein